MKKIIHRLFGCNWKRIDIYTRECKTCGRYQITEGQLGTNRYDKWVTTFKGNEQI